MSIIQANNATTDNLLAADLEAAERHFVEGTRYEPSLARRLREHGERISEEAFQRNGYIDVNKLIQGSTPTQATEKSSLAICSGQGR